ncbi:uncharacterized protein [Physcomitrium patens]|uniref:Suppressor of forked domain-containing protein n=1 Tax=Physcomitrium patens TaxID=3218 RepID=A0A7I4EI35_PHYPA|nr:protein NRDE2 homolog [Physcomitrium patens]|eukprot:XP_024385096.1 protein NRDE2 homolog [Physcomitrella patens]
MADLPGAGPTASSMAEEVDGGQEEEAEAAEEESVAAEEESAAEVVVATSGGAEEEAREASVSVNSASVSSTTGISEFAAGESAAATAPTGPFQAKFSSFPTSFAPPPAPRPVPSLFPSLGNVGSKQTPGGAPSWLSNSSFSENLLPPPLNSLASKGNKHPYGRDILDEIEEKEGKGAVRERFRAELGTETASSTSDSDLSKEDEGEKSRRKRRKEKRRKRRKEERKKRKERKRTGDELQIGTLDQSVDRKAVVKTWADGKVSLPKEYFVDTRGDRDNLAFGSLYRMDIARYVRQQVDRGEEGTKKRYATYLDVPEPDGDVQENKAYRYWSGEAMALETRRDLRRIRIHSLRPSAATFNSRQDLDTFIPLEEKDIKKKDVGDEDEQEEGESWNDYIIRRTREFNSLTRERPDDENSWLEFAKFQDELVHMAQRKGVKQQAVEKKISVLEKALEHHPDSLQLTLLYLESCRLRDTVPEMLAKWEKAAILLSGSYRFWKNFLQFVCSQFSLFSVATVRSVYVQALGSLTATRDRLKNGDERDTVIKDAELAMVSILADRCRFELQTGHAELGLAIFQAAMEYSLFVPLIQTTENNKRRLFEAFWDSQAPRIGEEGALGWALWLEKEEEQFQKARAQEAEQEEQAPGGWTGWSEPVMSGIDVKMTDSAANAGKNGDTSSEERDQDEIEGVESDEDEATLLAKLGISSMDAGKELEVTDSEVWLRWATEERKRACEQWLPIHALMESDEEDEQLARVIMFEDVRDTLVSISSVQAWCRLIGHFLEFCNIPLTNWCSSNDFSLQQGIEGLESLTCPLSRLRGIRSVGSNVSQYVVGNRESQEVRRGETILKTLVGEPEWFLESFDRTQFVCNALLLLQSSFSNSLERRHWDLTETLLVVQCLASDNGVKTSRNIAKRLLKIHRQDISLWTSYALVEGASGHMDTARKVLDTTLASLPALQNEIQEDAPFLFLACADMEVTHGSKTRALYVLCHFGSGIPYTPSANLEDPISPTLILKAKLGFQQHLQNVRRGRTYVRDTASFGSKPVFGGALDERGVAVIACCALFEELSSGWEAAVSIFEESLAFTLPGKWKESKECESLMERYVGLLRRSMPTAKPAQVRRCAMRGLSEYPHNSVLLEMLVQSSPSTYNLRRYFDDYTRRNPSTLLWSFALATELENIEGNAARIRSLFERALETKATQTSVVLWRAYLAYECKINRNIESARRIYFRAIHACPWSKKLWLDGFTMLSDVLTTKQLAEFQEIMKEKELRIRTDVFEILLEDAEDDS